MTLASRKLLLACLLSQALSLFVGVQFANGRQDDDSVQRADDSKLVEGLRRRRLFDLAELFCQKRLADPALDPTSQSHLTVELMKSQTAKAVLAPVGEREVAWKQIGDSAKRFIDSTTDHPRKILVQVQVALSHITHGKQIQQEVAAEMAAPSANESALAEFRIARKLLSDLDRDIDQLIPELRGRSLTEHDLTIEQLLTLKNNLRYQLAVCNLNQSQLYKKDDRLNRIAALNSVKESLAQVERSTSESQPIWWSAKMGQIECLRLLGDTGAAVRIAIDLSKMEVPDSIQGAFVEQKINLAIELGNEKFTRQVIKEFDELDTTTAQLDLAMIEFAVSLSARALTDEQKKKWLDFASQSARAIGVNRGAYWGRRADLVLIDRVGSAGNGTTENPVVKIKDPSTNNSTIGIEPNSINNTELAQLVRIGEDSIRKNNFDDAIKAYTAASKKARSLNDSNRALRLDMTVGQIQEQQSRPDLAAQTFIKAAFQDRDAEFASASHLRGCWNIAKTFKTKPENKKEFEEQLVEHLKIWPDKTSADQARMYLASQYQSQSKWAEANGIYLQVGNDSQQLKNALANVRENSVKILEQLKRENKSTFSESQNMVSTLAIKSRTMEQSNPRVEQIQLLQAELHLMYSQHTDSAGLQFSDSIVSQLSSSSDLKIARTAQAIKVATSGADELESAKAILEKISDDVGALVTCENCLATIAARNDNTNIKTLRLAAIEKLLVRNPTTSLLLKNSEALSQLDRHAEAVGILEKLEKQFPRNAGIQIQLARALTLDKKSDPSKSLTKWRRMQGQLKAYTPNWFEAKLNVAQLLVKSGKKAEALRLLKLLKEVGPGWEDSELKGEFEKLLEGLE